MKLVSFRIAARESFGLVVGDGIVELPNRLGVPTLKALLAAGRLEEARAFADAAPSVGLAQVELLPVIPDPAHIWCMAINYQDHIDEIQAVGIQREPPKKPALFMRYADTLVAHGDPLVKPKVSDDFDFEGELAVVIGKAGRDIPEAEAMDYVAGYSIFNDGSVRDWQFHTRQIAPGKNFRGTGSLGPWLVTRDEIADPNELKIETRLNGEALQRSSTRYMIHKIPGFIAYTSQILDLQPGDILATGTPSGVGFSRRPPIFMKAGDVCEVEIEGVGLLRNPVTAD
ncbi:MAG TPA: fumarylacetoacetate hydrolase family protein [Phenylobacterium sp.]|uniref:fumarylacetoacetate hydrolase family protein n=1 Tax=Phenylobacterium sp. TaxID=1871053 RepID=UPI002B495ADD|nr:fumarylacetoacetate hydrolase family protein [Phenylobacterium sp.]HKR86918.1 fumarylacetoacetate hydrolase family protein [Phenylobacterium sp.]HKT54822.1 fumarylacetoacetate hydrolase family protein [Caulobacteraceae bacterium]